MRKLLTTILLTALTASACWFTEANFNSAFIAGVNNFFAHYVEAETIEEATYANGQTVAMPLTVWVKVSPRTADQPGEVAGTKNIVRAVLQYKILPSGEWVTVKDYDTPDWDMNFEGAVPLFGMNCINVNVSAGTQMLIRVYLTDGTYETGDLATDITSLVPNTATLSVGGTYEGGWCAPHVMRVIISGRRPAR
ncbi:MAG: hypothetical protein WCT05_06755 [Lentisphaeria bacterium]